MVSNQRTAAINAGHHRKWVAMQTVEYVDSTHDYQHTRVWNHHSRSIWWPVTRNISNRPVETSCKFHDMRNRIQVREVSLLSNGTIYVLLLSSVILCLRRTSKHLQAQRQTHRNELDLATERITPSKSLCLNGGRATYIKWLLVSLSSEISAYMPLSKVLLHPEWLFWTVALKTYGSAISTLR